MSTDQVQTTLPAEPYRWPHDASFTPNQTALVVIDMQRDFCEEGGYFAQQGYNLTAIRELIPTIAELLRLARVVGFPVYHTREGYAPDLSDLTSRELFRSRNNRNGIGIGDQGPLGRLLVRGQPGNDTIPELYPVDGEWIIDKPGKGAFTHTIFEHLLRSHGIRDLILCGVTTDVCVSTTMREANDRGFDCVLVEDCCAAGNAELHKATLASVWEEGGIFGATTHSEDVMDAIRHNAYLAGDVFGAFIETGGGPLLQGSRALLEWVEAIERSMRVVAREHLDLFYGLSAGHDGIESFA